MEISYRREAKRNYLVAGMAENTAGYEARMLAHNEIRLSLVGSEMCIRDRRIPLLPFLIPAGIGVMFI